MQLFKKRRERLLNARRFQITLPESNNFPPFLFQGFYCLCIVGNIGVYLTEPPFGAGLWHYVVSAAFMAMPEAAMYKNDGPVSGQYYIGLAGHILYMQAVAVAMCMQVAAHQQFGLGILALYAAHVVAAGFLAMHVGHGIKLRSRLQSGIPTPQVWDPPRRDPTLCLRRPLFTYTPYYLSCIYRQKNIYGTTLFALS